MRPSLLAAEGLSWTAPDGRDVFGDVSLALGAGERVALDGPSGSGKSTVLRCLVGLEAPKAGTVRWDGVPVGPDNVLALRRAVRWVPQRAVAIAATVGDDLAVARQASPEGLDLDAQRDLLDQLGLADLPLDRPFDRLSGGEQQRVALVRALTGAPTVLLLDEPTASLDTAHRARAEAALAAWHAAVPGRAWLWITHDDGQRARIADRAVTLGTP